MNNINPIDKNLNFKFFSKRNITDRILTLISLIFISLSIIPLILVIVYILYKGSGLFSYQLLTSLPNPPGDEAGGLGNAIQGTIIVTIIATFISAPIGIGAGIYLAEYAKNNSFSRFIRFGVNVLSGVPSIIAGVFIYGIIVSTKIIFGANFSAIAGGAALSILMLPTIIKTTDEGLKLVSDDLRKAALGVGATKFISIIKITLPSAANSIGTGVILAVARAAGETAPLIFTALFSFYWADDPSSLLNPIASLSVLIYNFALEPYEAQNELAWAASFILVLFVLFLSLLSKWLSRIAKN